MRAGAVLCVALGGACASGIEFTASQTRIGVPVPDPAMVDAVVFLVGDAGDVQQGRSPLLEQLRADVEQWSRDLARDSAVTIVFLGDNVYPAGVHDRAHPDFPQDSARLQAQVDLLAGEAARRYNSVGLFLAGNHDWGNVGGSSGLERVRNLERELVRARQQGPKVALLPPAGLPGPVVRDLRENVRLLLMDSQWFLREPSDRARTLFFHDVREALETAGDREVIVLAHHPFATSGPHGVRATGSRSIGLLYLLQRSGTLVQDLNSPAYGTFRDRMRLTFKRTGRTPLVFAGGHDHSLQVIDGLQPGDPRNILVSGAASKVTSIGDTAGLRFGAERPGYMRLVFLTDGRVDLHVVAGDRENMLCPQVGGAGHAYCMRAGIASYRLVWSETLPSSRTDPAGEGVGGATPADTTRPEAGRLQDALANIESTPPAVAPDRLRPGIDSVVAAPGETYRAGAIERMLLGDLNRHLWEIEFTVPILDLDSAGGGLEPIGLSGDATTPILQLRGRDDLIYEFRPIVTNASRALPPVLRSTPAGAAMQDQMGARFPLGAAIVAELQRSAGMPVAKPTAAIMPDHPRLGEYRTAFAGRMGWIEVRADRPGDRDSARTDDMLEDVWNDPDARINEREYVRLRLIDMFVNEWDRDLDGWRWAKLDEDGRKRWDPIPRDPDWAFARIDGLLPRLAGVFYPQYVSFGREYANVKRLTWAGAQTDRYVLGGVPREVFHQEAAALHRTFTDSVIDTALDALPPQYPADERGRLRTALRERRDELPVVAQRYYELLARQVDTRGTWGADSIAVTVYADSVRIALWRGVARRPGFDRTFVAGETEEVRVYMLAGDDVVTIDGRTALPVRVRLVGEPADATLVHADSTILLIAGGGIDPFDGLSFHATLLPERVGEDGQPAAELPPPAVLAWETRDWGSQWLAGPAIGYESESGLHLGLTFSRLGFGFRQVPHESRLALTGLVALEPARLSGRIEYHRRIGLAGAALRFDVRGHTLRHSRFFGIGNETANTAEESFYTAFRPHLRADASVAWESPGESWALWAGPRMERWGALREADRPLIFDTANVYGADPYVQVGIQGGMRIDGRDDADMPAEGGLFTLEGRAFPGTADLRGPHGGVDLRLHTYWRLADPLEPTLHVRVFGGRTWGDAPYPDRAQLGGLESLPGYRINRFIGDAAASLSTLLRATLLDVGSGGGIRVGGYGIATYGRVWLDGIEDGQQPGHGGWGGGLFIRSDALSRSAAISFVQGERGWRTYLGLGMPF